MMTLKRWTFLSLTAAVVCGCAQDAGNSMQSGQDANDQADAGASQLESDPSSDASSDSSSMAMSSTGSSMRGEDLYDARCATCHGQDGTGDGPAAASLDPKPRDHTNPEWQASVTDSKMAEIIEQGGAAEGLSPSMPAHPDLSDTQVESLVDYIRSLNSEQ